MSDAIIQTVELDMAKTDEKRMDYITSSEVPIVMRMSLNALLNGLAAKEKQ